MSLLTNVQPTRTDAAIAAQQQARARQIALRLVVLPNQMFTRLAQGVTGAVSGLWVNPNPQDQTYPTPQQIWTAIQTAALARGGKASDVQSYFNAVIAFMEALEPGSTTAIIALTKPVTDNSDGSVTVNA